MVSIIEKIGELGPGVVIICIILVASLITSGKTLMDKLLESLDLKRGKSIREKELYDRIEEMEKQICELKNQINETQNEIYQKQKHYHEQSVGIRNELKDNQLQLSDQLKNLTANITKFMNREDENTVALFRNSLWRMHKEFMAQGYVTPDGLRTFKEMGRIYERCGGNDIYHDKLKPEVDNLEIHYPDGSIYSTTQITP